MNLAADVFLEAALSITSWEKERSSTAIGIRFAALFGAQPLLCSLVWRRIYEAKQGSMPRASPKHLLWALMFLKTYETEAVISSIVEADEKTVRKWVWFFVRAIADLDVEVVSTAGDILTRLSSSC
jgi:hypothetical protein